MIYLDTSFLTPLFREEPVSECIEGFLAAVPAGTLAIRQWTRVEFASVIARDRGLNVLLADASASLCIAPSPCMRDKPAPNMLD